MLAVFPLLAALTFTAEVPVTNESDRGPAPFAQSAPSIATDGRSFVIAWNDPRTADLASTNRLHFVALSPEGEVVDRDGVIGPATPLRGAVGANGSSYFAAWRERNDIVIGRLGDDLRFVGEPRRLRTGAGIVGLVSGAPRMVLLTNSREVGVLDASGSLIGWSRMFLEQGEVSAVPLPDGRVQAFTVDVNCDVNMNCFRRLWINTIPTSGGNFARIVVNEVGVPGYHAAVFGAGRILLAVSSGTASPQTIDYMLLDIDGNVIVEKQRITASVEHGATPLSAGWDGRQFLLGWSTHAANSSIRTLQAVRIDSAGKRLDDVPIRIGGPSAFAFKTATNGQRVVLVTEEGSPKSEIVARVMPSFAQLAEARTTVLSTSLAMQEQSAAASIGDDVLAVWRHRDEPAGIVGSLFKPGGEAAGKVMVISAPVADREQHSPAVAASRSGYLVAWTEVRVPETDGFGTLARRVSAAGVVLDHDPIVLASYDVGARAGEVAVGSNGREYLVVWNQPGGQLVAARVDTAGRVVDSHPFPIAVSTPQPASFSPTVHWNGSEYVLVWAEKPSKAGAPRPVRSARVTSEGIVLPRGEGDRPLGQLVGEDDDLATAKGSDGLMAAWHSKQYLAKCLEVMPLDLQGRPRFSGSVPVDCSLAFGRGAEEVAISWDGNRYIVTATRVENGRSKIVAFALDRNGNLLERQDVTTADSLPISDLASISTSHGISLLYSRVSPAHGVVKRLYARTMIGAQQRLRGTRP